VDQSDDKLKHTGHSSTTDDVKDERPKMRIKYQLLFAVAIFLIFSTAMLTHAQIGEYTTYVAGKPLVVDHFQVTTNADGIKRKKVHGRKTSNLQIG
jgi:hypothetical protein